MASLALAMRDQAGVRRPRNEKRGGSQGYHRVSGLVQRKLGADYKPEEAMWKSVRIVNAAVFMQIM